jgi:peptidoglycan hydrolase-like protein with peptidoglycan-binding domain
MVTIKLNTQDKMVTMLQYALNTKVSGTADTEFVSAVKSYQKSKKLTADGIVGKNTYKAFLDDFPNLKKGKNKKSNWNKAWQSFLGVKVDGIFGADTKKATQDWQKANGLTADGIVGDATLSKAFGITVSVSAPSTSNGTTVVNKQPVNYKQYDSRWGKIVYTMNGTYNKNQTIKSSGCGPTAAANIVATWWDSSVTPATLAALSVKHGYRTKNSGTSWGFFKFIAEKYGASKFVQTSSYATAEAAIKEGALVVCSVGPGVWTKGGHFITWWKVDNTYVYINDPASASSSRAKSKKSNLKEQKKQFFIFYK